MTRTMLILGATVLVLSIVLWLGLVGTVLTMNQSDAAGNGLSHAFAMLLAIALWALLAGLLLIAGSRGGTPAWARIAAVCLLPLSLAGSMAAVQLVHERIASPERWPALVPILIPPLIMAYCVWAALPSFRAAVPAHLSGGIVWGLVLALSASPWALFFQRGSIHAAEQERAKAHYAEQTEREHQENLAGFNALTADSPLGLWIPFTAHGNELRDQALAAIRGLDHRQADAEAMIERGEDWPLLELRHLDLQPTPRLAAVACEFMRKKAEAFAPSDADPRPFALKVLFAEVHLPALYWLMARGCDCESALAAYQRSAEGYPESRERTQFLETLAKFRVEAGTRRP